MRRRRSLKNRAEHLLVGADARRQPERGAGEVIGHVRAAVRKGPPAESLDEIGEVREVLRGLRPSPARDWVGGKRDDYGRDRCAFVGWVALRMVGIMLARRSGSRSTS